MNPKQFDRGGDMWEIDRQSKKIKRQKTEAMIEQIEHQGFFSKFASGADVLYDSGTNIFEAVVVKPISEEEYEIKIGSDMLTVPAESLFDKTPLF